MMPSQRRIRLFGVLIVITVIALVYMSRGGHQTRTSDFYTKTQEALQELRYEEAAKQRDAEDVGSRLKAAEEQAKQAADKKYESKKVAVEGDDQKSVAGRVKIDGDKVPGVAAQGGRSRDQAVVKEDETLEDHEVEMELNAILKKSPIIIFSKSYCPFSKKAKHILLEKYRIVPEPYVVELDINPLGEKLQALLAKSTGRRTVPNILLMGKSIGGGDDMEELDETDTLVDKIKEMGGSRITEVEHRGARAAKPHRRAKRS
ncbi:hypothetical protein N0V83_006749 [Neocucurbitaria cava]|uniref:Glutaredoxin domain-containing protein n=1 Tax=Neocucurbitaria cava TaxID=798079 RepID=A0A9W8Y7H3_9PLEO|nr:hypothetical protein N0V83_006749 [Neocucurbitaria cava]